MPIIIITAQTDTHDLVAGLEAGADDYVTKPVVPKELAARIRALLRRVHAAASSTARPRPTRFGDVELRRDQGIVLKAGDELSLTKTEFRLLCEFADHAGAVLSRDQLLERVWGYEYLGDSPPRRRPRPAAAAEDRGSPRRSEADRHRRGIGYRCSLAWRTQVGARPPGGRFSRNAAMPSAASAPRNSSSLRARISREGGVAVERRHDPQQALGLGDRPRRAHHHRLAERRDRAWHVVG